MSDERGLYDKYEVYRDGEPVEEACFVLKPESDPAARRALIAYMGATDNQTLEKDLWDWLREIRGFGRGFANENDPQEADDE